MSGSGGDNIIDLREAAARLRGVAFEGGIQQGDPAALMVNAFAEALLTQANTIQELRAVGAQFEAGLRAAVDVKLLTAVGGEIGAIVDHTVRRRLATHERQMRRGWWIVTLAALSLFFSAAGFAYTATFRNHADAELVCARHGSIAVDAGSGRKFCTFSIWMQ